MQRKTIALLGLLTVTSLACFLGISRTEIHTSAETGSRRGYEYRAGFIPVGSWEHISWIEKRAKKMHILPAQQQWVKTADTRTTFFITSYGHAKAPASYMIGGFDAAPEEYSQSDLDTFVRKFVNSSELEREEYVRQFFDGTFNQ